MAIFISKFVIFKINRSNVFPPFLKEIYVFVCLFPWLQASLAWKRSYFVLGLAMFAVFGSIYFGFPGSGGLCTLVLAFVAGVGWSDEKVNVYIKKHTIPKLLWMYSLTGVWISVRSGNGALYEALGGVWIKKKFLCLFWKSLTFSMTESYHVCEYILIQSLMLTTFS